MGYRRLYKGDCFHLIMKERKESACLEKSTCLAYNETERVQERKDSENCIQDMISGG